MAKISKQSDNILIEMQENHTKDQFYSNFTLEYLNPIHDHLISGRSIRYEKIYDEIEAARYEENPALAQGIWQHELKHAQWDEVEKKSTLVLQKYSKDLQVTAWLAEAWSAKHGIEGIQKGIILISRITQTFWDTLYPMGDDFEARLHIYEWCDTQLTYWLQKTPLTSLEQPHVWTFNDWVASIEIEQQSKRAIEPEIILQKATQEGKIERTRLKEIIHITPSIFREQIIAHTQIIWQELDVLCVFLDQKMGKNAPNFIKIRRILTEIMHIFNSTASYNAPQKSQSSASLPPTIEATQSQTTIIAERAHAYQALRELSIFLGSLDPHSPAPQLLELIAGWENLTLGEILSDIPKRSMDTQILLKLLADGARLGEKP